MTWSLVPDVHRFREAAERHLAADPIGNSTLLTETAYLVRRGRARADQQFGCWRSSAGRVEGAFLQAPRHRPTLSLMSPEAVVDFVHLPLAATGFDVDIRLLELARIGWRARWSSDPVEDNRITLYRLTGPPAGPRPPEVPGRGRLATLEDRDLLLSWYRRLLEETGDASDLEYLVDDPLEHAGLVVWDVDGQPVAVAARSRPVAGMARVGATYSPVDGAYAHAALVYACAAARRVADHVLVFAGAGDTDADTRYRALGFRPVLERVTLLPRGGLNAPHDQSRATAPIAHE